MFSFVVFAQKKFTLSGTVTSKKNGESLIGATIKVLKNNTTVTSNEYGFYSITLPAGKYSLEVSFVDMNKHTKEVSLDSNVVVNIFMDDNANTLSEVVINAVSKGRKVAGTQIGVEHLSMQEIKNIPMLLGERDVMKAIQLLPGIKSAGEGNSGIYVRGGAADQNLILLDEAPVYNASHLLGFFSTFNADAVKDITVYKAGMPAQYGGRLSSVIDIRMNDGNNQRFTVSGGLGLISSKLNIEAPIQKDNSSFLLSGRTTYVDVFLKLSKDSAINRNALGFYDLNAKMNYTLGKKDHFFLSGYFGSDHLDAGGNFKLKWGNSTGTLRWNHIYSNRIFSNTSLIYSNFNYDITIKNGTNDVKIFSEIKDWNLKEELQWNPNASHRFRIGVNTIYHAIRPGDVTSSATSSFNSIQFQKRYSIENAAYFSDNFKLNEKISLLYGSRFTSFSLLGKGNFYNLNANGRIIDTTKIAKGKIFKTYFNIEPRLALSYLINSTTSVKSSYVRNTQNLHLISNTTSTNPTDKWVASTNNIKPEISDQVSIGYYKDFSSGKYEFTAETYYKSMQHQIDYRDGSDVTNADALETQLLYGKGRAYGLEFLIKKKLTRLSGWISYTLSKTEKKIAGINSGKWYNARQDRTHDIAVVTMYHLNNKWTLSANWIFYTGDAISFPGGKYSIANQTYFYYTERNGYRMPNYHRLDLGAVRVLKKRKNYSSELTFSLYNAYGRENAYTITFRENKNDPSKTEAVRTALFKYIPSVSYNFKF